MATRWILADTRVLSFWYPVTMFSLMFCCCKQLCFKCFLLGSQRVPNSIVCLALPSWASSFPSTFPLSALGPHCSLNITVTSWLVSQPTVFPPHWFTKDQGFQGVVKPQLQSRSSLSSKPLLGCLAQGCHHRAWAGHLMDSVGCLSTLPATSLSRWSSYHFPWVPVTRPTWSE